MPEKRDTIAIIGLGKVGAAMGRLLRSAGYTIAAVAGASRETVLRNLEFTGGAVCDDPSEAAAMAECVLITTRDDAIASVCGRISGSGAVGPGKKVVHMSGAGGLDLLAEAARRGAFVASIHPIQAFASVEDAISSIPGSTFGITADEAVRDWAVRFVRDVGGVPFFVPESRKALYHAAACVASNYLVALMHMVAEIAGTMGIDEREAIRAYWPLVLGTIRNIEKHGTVHALTGPIARGDAGTVERHVRAFGDFLPRYLEVYRVLGDIAADVAVKKKSVTPEKAEAIRSILEGRNKE